MFYNVENLFDTIDAPDKFDEEFMPVEPKNWNTERYEKKLSDLSRVISSVDTINLPSLVGVCEIENDAVLNDLVKQTQLQRANYKIVWEDGPDFRGIDCALLYNPEVFTLISHESLPVVNPKDLDFNTRDVLYVQGEIGDELFHVFVNHWPSRLGGEAISEPKRVLAAKVVRQKVDAIFESEEMANIIIMGDMNDEPGNMSLSDILMALPNTTMPGNNQLVNLMHDEYDNGLGSYSYNNDWNMIDNMVVSGALINKQKGLKSKLDNGFVFHLPFMEYVNKEGNVSPNRTYGRSYYGGISDHFPIYMLLD
jgi:predicted extracellular nuclease